MSRLFGKSVQSMKQNTEKIDEIIHLNKNRSNALARKISKISQIRVNHFQVTLIERLKSQDLPVTKTLAGCTVVATENAPDYEFLRVWQEANLGAYSESERYADNAIRM